MISQIPQQTQQQSWYSILYSSLLSIGTILLLLSFSIDGIPAVNMTIVGYCFLVTSILLIISNMFKVLSKAKIDSMASFAYIFFNNTGPFLLNIATILFLLVLTVKYTNIISTGNLSNQYYSFSKLSTLLILIQMAVFYQGLTTKKYKQENKLPVIYSSFSYLVGVINLYIAIVIKIILAYYTTDG